MLKSFRFLLSPAIVGALAVASVAGSIRAADPIFIAPPPPPGIVVYALTGHVQDLELKYNADQTRLKVHATVSLHNNLDTALDHLTARVYVSDHPAFRPADLLLSDVKIAAYLPDGKLAKHETVTLPIKRGVSSAMASYLDGKYLHVVVSRDGETVGVIKFGPIKAP
jgi:hypothetical protein